MSIDAGNSAISQAHQQARANNDAQIAKQRETTEAKKNEAAENAKSAFDEINDNHSGTFTGAVKEAGGDALDALGAGADYLGASVADVISDAATAIEDDIYDAASTAAERREIAGNMVSNTANGLVAVGSFIFGSIANAAANVHTVLDEHFEEGTLKNHPEEKA